MKHLSIRFLIGLHVSTRPPEDGFENRPAAVEGRVETALAILAHNYPGLTSWRGTGYWQGKPEPALVVETVVVLQPDLGDEVERARDIAREVARALGQDAVALAVSGVRFSLEGRHGTA